MIKVNENECIGCGVCASLCPEIFQMNNDYKAEVISQVEVDCAKRAATTCPVNAISIK